MLTACSAPGNRYAWSGVVSFTSKPTLCFSRHQPEIPLNFDLSCWVRTDPSGDIQVPQVFSLPQTTSESQISACPPNLQISHSMCPSSRVAIWQTVWQKKNSGISAQGTSWKQECSEEGVAKTMKLPLPLGALCSLNTPSHAHHPAGSLIACMMGPLWSSYYEG